MPNRWTSQNRFWQSLTSVAQRLQVCGKNPPATMRVLSLTSLFLMGTRESV